TSSGGHAPAHAPVHALFVPWSALKRYRVRPCELTRIWPIPVLEMPTVAALPLAVFGGGVVEAVASPPPHPASTGASRASPPAPITPIDLDLVRVMLAPYVR